MKKGTRVEFTILGKNQERIAQQIIQEVCERIGDNMYFAHYHKVGVVKNDALNNSKEEVRE